MPIGLLIVIGIATLLIGLSSRLLWRHYHTQRWPRVAIEVESCEVVCNGPMTVLGTGARYHVQANYHYNVEGQEYWSDQVYYDHQLLTEEGAQALAADIRAHKHAYYCPTEPKLVFLRHSSPLWPICGLIAGLALLALTWG